MSEHYYRVGVHGPPDPDEHPWVMRRNEYEDGWRDPWEPTENSAGLSWFDGDEWFPIDAPPSELAPEPEERWTVLRQPGHAPAVCRDGKQVDPDEVVALLNDQPPVPRALVDWLRHPERAAAPWRNNKFYDGQRTGFADTLKAIEAGEFGPVEGER